MKVVDVIPLSKGIGKEVLSYFSAKEMQLGSLVNIPVRKKVIPGITIAIHDAKKLKAHLKSSDYKLRNVSSVQKTSPFNPVFLRTCIHLKNYYASSTGSILSAYTPKVILDNLDEFNFPEPVEPDHRTDLLPERSVFQAPLQDRIDYYKTLVREQFASRKSVYICTPTQAHADALYKELTKGIENRVVVIHTGLSKKKLIESVHTIQDSDQAQLIIGTANFLILAQPEKFSTIITEFEGSEYYRRQVKPYIDTRDFVYTYAYLSGMSFIAADELVQANTIYRSEREYFTPIKPTHFKIKKNIAFDFLYPTDKEFELKTYPLLAKKTLSQINKAISAKKPVVIFTPRKGLAPISVCQDCGTTVVDPSDEKTPLVLHEKGKKRFYQNPKTNEKFEATDACTSCGGWRIKGLGISTKSMEQYLELKLEKKEVSLHIVDGTETNTPTKTKKVLNEWYTSNGILITTEKSLSYLIDYMHSAHTVVIASLESLIASPAYTAHERLARLVLSFADVATDNFIIQTRDTELPILKGLEKGNLADWYKIEMKDREDFNYPPFGVTLKIETIGTKDIIEKKDKKLVKLFGDFIKDRQVYKDKKVKEQHYKLSVTMTLPNSDWIGLPAQKNRPDIYMDMFTKLQSLPENFSIYVNPSSLL